MLSQRKQRNLAEEDRSFKTLFHGKKFARKGEANFQSPFYKNK
jgi:hypothetical protein